MNIEIAVDILRNMITYALMLVSPLMITAIVVGLFVSLIQSVTSIQEQTLTFVPKLLGIGLIIILTANWMLKSLVEFTVSYIQRMPNMAP